MKKILSVILALMLMMQMLATFVIAAPEDDQGMYLHASHETCYVGDQVQVKLTVEDNLTGFAGIEGTVEFDKAILKLISIDFSQEVTAHFAEAQATEIGVANNNGTAKITLLSIENLYEDILIATLTFEVLSEVAAQTVINLNGDRASYAMNEYNIVDLPGFPSVSSSIITIKEKPAGVTVSGTVTSFNSDTDDVTVALYKDANGAADYTVTVKGNSASYAIETVAAGTYTMKVSKKNHVTREYTVTVGETAVTQDAKICLLGDVNGNGRIQINDINALYKHFRNVELLDDYAAKCGDVIGTNGRVQINDVNALYKHFRGQDSLWD